MTDTTASAPESSASAVMEAPQAKKNVQRRRIGVAPFLNAQPLIWGLSGSHDLPPVAPNAMAKGLKDGSLDAALAPVVASFLNPDLVPIPVAAVGSKGAVRTVRILSNGAPQGIKRLFVDDRSQTSVLQAKLTLKKWFGVRDLQVDPVSMQSFRPGQTKPWEAVLQFGDNALVSAPTGMTVTDLGGEWYRFTGKPFVNALWLARDSRVAAELKDQLAEAKSQGLAHLDEIAAGYHGIWQFKRADAKAYLQDNIRYEYGEEEQAGQAEFQRLLQAEGLLA